MQHIGDLTPDPVNARKHGQRNLDVIADTLQQVGAARSIVIDEDGVILAGNGVVEAAAQVGIDRVQVVDADGETIIAVRRTGLTDEQKRRLALADNRAGELAEWDTEVLAAMAEDGTDFHGLWSDDELAELLEDADLGVGTEGLTDADAVPEPPAAPVTKPGDLWLLGEHRLLCGDSTVLTEMERATTNERAAMMWTDPPYGVNYVGKTKDALTIANDTAEGLAGLLHDAFSNAQIAALQEGAAFYIARPAVALSVTFGNVILGLGWRLHEELQWIKDAMVLGHSDYHIKHETIMFGYLPGGGRRGRGGTGWYGDHSQVSVFEVPRPKASPDHPTGKPVDLIKPHLQNSSTGADLVLDVFGGSGSTLIACQELGRRSVMIEIDPVYCDVIVERWQQFTGQGATREAA